MATLGAQFLTLADWAKRIDKNGKIDKIAEMLSQQNEILSDMLFTEGNLPTGHRASIRTGLPTTYWKLIGQGSPISKSTTAQVDEHAAILEAWSEVDKDLALLGGNVGSFRLSESQAFLESMNQEMAATLFYGASTAPEEFVGLANRYSSTSDNNGANILLAGGSSANTSVWLANWSPMGAFGIFPKGSKAGIEHEDMGLQTINTTDSGTEKRQRVYQDRWCWKSGLVVKDWRHVVRIANVDTAALVAVSGTQATSAATNILKLMARATARLPKNATGKKAFYVNRTVASMLHVLGLEYSSTALAVQPALDQFGNNIYEMSFMGIPVRICDSITSAETTVS
jgi:hypothetical protein